MVTRAEIASFLATFKGCVMAGRLEVLSRPKNRQALLDLDSGPERRREVLLGLEPEDYVAGPEPDHADRTKEVWKFGKIVDEQEIYVKLRVTDDPRAKNAHHALVWSFHPAERKLSYPLKGGGGS